MGAPIFFADTSDSLRPPRRRLAKDQVRLPFNPLPSRLTAIGLSQRSRVRRKKRGRLQPAKSHPKVRWNKKLRQAVRDRHGPNCHYCGLAPGERNFACHEVFEFDVKPGIIRLADIVPACARCHYWADGRAIVVSSLARSLFWTKGQAKAYARQWRHTLDDPEVCFHFHIQQYHAGRHFRRVNGMSINAMRNYIRRAVQHRGARNRKQKWRVDYGEWSQYAGLANGEYYVPPMHTEWARAFSQ